LRAESGGRRAEKPRTEKLRTIIINKISAMKKIHLQNFLLFILLMFASVAFSQNDTLPGSDEILQQAEYEIFHDVDPLQPEEPLRINIEFDYRDFLQMKYQDTSLLANLSVYDHDSLLYSTSVKIKARGTSRKKICFFPPFELNFKKSDPDAVYTGEMNKLKMVTQCKNNAVNQQYLIKEYLCYKMLNMLTDYSYKVRLVQIKFTDSAGKVKPYENYGFIMETHSHLAKRISAYPVEIMGIRMKQTDYDAMHLINVFQFMIGNTDWDVPSLHNIRLYKLQDFHRLNPVPITYDFDYAGLVNADYAVPHMRFGTTTVRERVYMGNCIPYNDYQTIFEKFIEKEEQFYNLINNFELLEKYNKTDMVRYLGEFFAIIKNDKLTEVNISRRCLNEN
jgi:hypothetical protein